MRAGSLLPEQADLDRIDGRDLSVLRVGERSPRPDGVMQPAIASTDLP